MTTLTNDAPVSPQAQKILGLIEATPYQGEALSSLIFELKDAEGIRPDTSWSDDYDVREAIVCQCLKELKAAGLIYKSTVTTWGQMWIAVRHRSLNEEFDRFIDNGKARSLLRALRIKKIDELCRFTANDLMKIRNCGRKTVSAITEALRKRGLILAQDLSRATPLEQAAINLHDFLWDNIGVTDDWPVKLSGDDGSTTQTIDLLNRLQEEIEAAGLSTKSYHPHLP
jgi:Bacterial RNA polymerase, alpha chain C terminal domain